MITVENSVVSGARPGPPRLPRDRRVRPLGWMLVVALATVSSVWLARGIASGAVPYPACGFKALTSLPCPGCGGTRSLAALGEFDVIAALTLNPLIAGLALAVLLALPIAALDAALNRQRWLAQAGRALSSSALPWLIAAALAANWIYLLLARAS